jgi:methionyl-tRNA formyltransferase
VAWAIYHGEARTGVTIIRMTTGLDAGDILAQAWIVIGEDETAGELEARLAPLGAQLALKAIDQFATAAHGVHGFAQDKAQVTKAPKLKKEDGLIDWSRGASEVCNQIRAMQPWPTAYTFFHRQGKAPMRIIILRGQAYASLGHPKEQPPGTPDDGAGDQPCLMVHAKHATSVRILELQPAGKKRMTAEEFLRGHPIQPGDHFGPETE